MLRREGAFQQVPCFLGLALGQQVVCELGPELAWFEGHLTELRVKRDHARWAATAVA